MKNKKFPAVDGVKFTTQPTRTGLEGGAPGVDSPVEGETELLADLTYILTA